MIYYYELMKSYEFKCEDEVLRKFKNSKSIYSVIGVEIENRKYDLVIKSNSKPFVKNKIDIVDREVLDYLYNFQNLIFNKLKVAM